MSTGGDRGRSFRVDRWSDKAMDWILRATPHPNRNQLLAPALAALAADAVARLDKAGKDGPPLVPPELLEEGRVLLREYALRNPAGVR